MQPVQGKWSLETTGSMLSYGPLLASQALRRRMETSTPSFPGSSHDHHGTRFPTWPDQRRQRHCNQGDGIALPGEAFTDKNDMLYESVSLESRPYPIISTFSSILFLEINFKVHIFIAGWFLLIIKVYISEIPPWIGVSLPMFTVRPLEENDTRPSWQISWWCGGTWRCFWKIFANRISKV